jgi:hypothetical protein
VLKIPLEWFYPAAMIAAGLVNWFIGRSLNRPLEQAGIGYWKRHWFMFIQMEWWSAVFIVFGLGIAVALLMGK